MSRKSKIADDLPVLTDMVGEATGSLPVLTEVVDEATGNLPTLPETVGEATVKLPILTDEIGEATVRLPRLTEVVAAPAAESDEAEDAPLSATAATETESFPSRLQLDLEAHIESVFTQKLQRHLAEAQQHAIELAIAELKAELPDLILNALDTPHDPQ